MVKNQVALHLDFWWGGVNEIVGILLTVSEQSLKHFLVGLRLDVCRAWRQTWDDDSPKNFLNCYTTASLWVKSTRQNPWCVDTDKTPNQSLKYVKIYLIAGEHRNFKSFAVWLQKCFSCFLHVLSPLKMDWDNECVM